MAIWDQPLVLLYTVLALVVIGYLASISMRARREGENAEGMDDDDVDPLQSRPGEDMLLRFVHDADGKKYGETVAVDEGRLILKDGDAFFAVALSSFQPDRDEVLVAADVDWESARDAGAEWRQASHKLIDYDDSELPSDEPEPSEE